MTDLRDARSRIIEAADAERRRIERDLHDGAQQRLVALALTLRMAEKRAAEGDAQAAELVRQAGDEAGLALKELRDLARGIHPAILTNRGLPAALDDLAGRASVPVEVVAAPTSACPTRSRRPPTSSSRSASPTSASTRRRRARRSRSTPQDGELVVDRQRRRGRRRRAGRRLGAAGAAGPRRRARGHARGPERAGGGHPGAGHDPAGRARSSRRPSAQRQPLLSDAQAGAAAGAPAPAVCACAPSVLGGVALRDRRRLGAHRRPERLAGLAAARPRPGRRRWTPGACWATRRRGARTSRASRAPARCAGAAAACAPRPASSRSSTCS